MLLRKFAPSLALPLTLLVMEWNGYLPGVEQQSASAVRAVRILMGPLPAVLLIIGAVFAAFYPLTRKKYEEVRKKLSEQRKIN